MKKLSDVLWFDIPQEFKELIVSDICDDSRKVTNGCLFVALSGFLDDGKKYIDSAISSGAKYIVSYDKNIKHQTILKNSDSDIIFIYVDDPRIALAKIASSFFESKFDNIVAITGTNGKSSTADISRQILSHNNRKATSVGTLGVILNDRREKLSGNLTSPASIELHKILKKLNDEKVSDVVLEASSHGIEQCRLNDIPFSVCAFTNFSQDHLDYHKTMDEYWNAKKKLFVNSIQNKSSFVINSDSEYYDEIISIAKCNNINYMTYGYKSEHIKILDAVIVSRGYQLKISFLEKEISFLLPLHGKFQIYNSLCAMAISYFSGVDINNIVNALEKIKPIPGRLELVADVNSVKIFVDYAHTPDALQNTINSLKDANHNRIIVVFGCGGNREHKKRSIMGEIAAHFSDIVIVTDDNPSNNFWMNRCIA